MARQLKADLILLVVNMIWGTTFVMTKGAVSEYPPFPFLSLRFGIALLAIVPFLLARRGRWKEDFPPGLLIGVFLFAGLALQTVALKYTSASNVGFIAGMSVVLVPLLSPIILRQVPDRWSAVGAVLAMIGLTLLTLGPQFQIAKGDWLAFAGTWALALQIISVGYFSPGRDVTALATGEMAVVLALSVVVGLWSGFPVDPSGKVLGAAVFMGLFATTFAFVAQIYSQKFTPATHAALISASEPVFAALYSYLAAGEVLSLRGWVGGMLIVLGMVVAEMFPTFSKG